ncbi:MAG: YqcC family protein [Pseudomonadota bacterium]
MEERIRSEITERLVAVEIELRRIGVWETALPTAEQLASDVPFSHDRLEFTQWLQWIFLPRFRAVLEGGHPLPQSCAVAPIAEDALARLNADTALLLAHLQDIDRLITERVSPPSAH